MSSLDYQRLKQKLDQLNTKKRTFSGNKFEKRTWSPDSTKVNHIRLIQYPHGRDPFLELWFHYNVGKSFGFLCPRLNDGKTCPVCDFAFDLNRSGDPTDKATAKKIFAKQRFYAAVVDREDPTLTPKLWGFGIDIYKTLLDKLLGEDYKNLLDPNQGFDAEVKCEKRGEYTVPKIELRITKSKLAETEEKIKSILESIPRGEDVFRAVTTVEVSEKLNEWLQLTDKDGGEVTRGKNGIADGSSETNEEGESDGLSVKNLDEAFEEALRD